MAPDQPISGAARARVNPARALAANLAANPHVSAAGRRSRIRRPDPLALGRERQERAAFDLDTLFDARRLFGIAAGNLGHTDLNRKSLPVFPALRCFYCLEPDAVPNPGALHFPGTGRAGAWADSGRQHFQLLVLAVRGRARHGDNAVPFPFLWPSQTDGERLTRNVVLGPRFNPLLAFLKRAQQWN